MRASGPGLLSSPVLQCLLLLSEANLVITVEANLVIRDPYPFCLRNNGGLSSITSTSWDMLQEKLPALFHCCLGWIARRELIVLLVLHGDVWGLLLCYGGLRTGENFCILTSAFLNPKTLLLTRRFVWRSLSLLKTGNGFGLVITCTQDQWGATNFHGICARL